MVSIIVNLVLFVVVIILLLCMDLFGWMIVVVLVFVVDNSLLVNGKNVLDVMI